MRRLSRRPRGLGFHLPELRHDPVQHAAARGHAAVGDVEPRHDVKVDEHARVGHRPLAREHDVPGTAELDHEVALIAGAGNERRGDMIGATGHHGRAGNQSGLFPAARCVTAPAGSPDALSGGNCSGAIPPRRTRSSSRPTCARL